MGVKYFVANFYLFHIPTSTLYKKLQQQVLSGLVIPPIVDTVA